MPLPPTPLDSPCIEWDGARRADGYGKVPTGQRHGEALAHRVVWEQHNGPIPPGMVVMHRCDNPPCINRHHLTLGTPGDNNRDAASKGRNRRRALTPVQVGDIRRARERGVPVAELARRYGCSASQVRKVANSTPGGT